MYARMETMMYAALTDAQRWRAVTARDRTLEGAFLYGVRSTGIYCRPGCPSRRPRRDQVEFFPVPAAAERAGYRACRRCRPQEAEPHRPEVALAERACRLLDSADGPVTLAALAGRLRVSPAHLQRTFSRVTGISPRAYADARRVGRLRRALRSGASVTGALYDAGYGSPSRVYERKAAAIGMTPATYARGGAGMSITWTTADSALGRVLVAATTRGLCFVGFGASDRALEQALVEEFPRAFRQRDDRQLGNLVRGVLDRVAGRAPDAALPLDVRATAFQRLVWEELGRVPAGTTVTYAELARRIGKPDAVRAVAGAVASNNVAVVIPCHRVVRSDGTTGGYRWGEKRKERLLALEGGPTGD